MHKYKVNQKLPNLNTGRVFSILSNYFHLKKERSTQNRSLKLKSFIKDDFLNISNPDYS